MGRRSQFQNQVLHIISFKAIILEGSGGNQREKKSKQCPNSHNNSKIPLSHLNNSYNSHKTLHDLPTGLISSTMATLAFTLFLPQPTLASGTLFLLVPRSKMLLPQILVQKVPSHHLHPYWSKQHPSSLRLPGPFRAEVLSLDPTDMESSIILCLGCGGRIPVHCRMFSCHLVIRYQKHPLPSMTTKNASSSHCQIPPRVTL